MFLDNKYTKWYFRIVEAAKSKNRKKNPEQYFEKHHIIPKCCGGASGSNLVLLTAREHFVCHMLLFHMSEGQIKSKMYNALQRMAAKGHPHKEIYRSRTYESLRTAWARFLIPRDMNGSNNPMYGKKQTDHPRNIISKLNKSTEHREKLRIICIERNKKPVSLETRKKMSDAKNGKTLTQEHRQNIAQRQIEINKNPERRLKLSKAATIWWEKRKTA